MALLYGEGTYNQCTYNGDCPISVATTGTVSLPLTPTATGVYTIAKDSVTVTTDNPTGYSLTLETNDDGALGDCLEDGPSAICATSGTTASPAVLDLNSWGFRLDGLGSFGLGPTAALSNGSSSSLTFAAVPKLNSPTVIKSSGVSATTGDVTDVWYGVRVNTTPSDGDYYRTVIYTAVTL